MASNVPTGTDVHAFLIADVRGWTSFTQARGDEESGRLAARFAEVAREVIKEHQGEVLELRGDEALCVFGSPRSAIRAAVALQQRFVEETIADPSLPLTVGVGLDAGEAVPVEGGYRGGALNVAARLCSRARAGEVLASQEIVHLARRIDGIRFTERGKADMKGLDQPVHMVAVRAEAADTVEAIAPFIRSTTPAPAPHRRRNAVAAVVAFVLIAALVAIPLARRSAGSSEIAPNSIGVLDADSGELVSTLGLTARPGSIASSEDAVWVTNPDEKTVTRIDANEQAAVDSVHVGENPTGIAAGFDAVWVVNSGGPSVSRISADAGEVFDPIPVGNGPAGIAAGEGAVWVTNRFDGTISRISPATNEVVETIKVGLDPRGIATGFGSVWVGLAGSNKVVRIDPATNKVTTQIDVGNAPGPLASSVDGVWVANTLDDTVSRITPDTNSVVPTVGVGDGPSGIAVVGDVVWVANEADGTLSRVAAGETPEQPSVRTMSIGSVPQGLADANGQLWVSVRGTATEHVGGTLRVVSLSQPGRKGLPLDSAVVIDPHEAPWMHLLGDGLVGFEPIGGTTPTLVADLATSYPTITPDRLRYTFQLREGIRYSNGEFVAPSDFRRAIERGFRLEEEFSHGHSELFAGIKGGKACSEEPRTCDLSSGIETDDAAGTIAFELVAPDPDFLYKLANPFAYPVPPSVPRAAQINTGIPGTGPYKLLAPASRGELVLVRNPFFQIWTPAHPYPFVERIEWKGGVVDPQARIDAVVNGDADLALDLDDDGSAQGLEEILIGFPAQVHTSPSASTFFVKIDATRPPFDNVLVRRALNFALDRDRIVQIYGGVAAVTPTCQLLPPNFPGYERYCPYTMDPDPDGSWVAPDLEKAKNLVGRSGTRGMRVVFDYPVWWPNAKPMTDYMSGLLEELGYRADVEISNYGCSPCEFQLAYNGWGAGFPSASDYIVPLITCDASPSSSAGSWQPFCDPRIDAKIDRATRAQADNPTEAGARWAAVDHAIANEAPYIWLYNQNSVGFVSDNVGNYQISQQYDVLLNQLWVQ